MNLKNLFSDLLNALDELDSNREEILKVSRSIIRDCSIAIKHIHRRQFEDYSEKLKEIKTAHQKLLPLINSNPGVFFKYLKTPEQEYTEAVVFYSIISKNELPTPKQLNIVPLHYALGLADVIGELRRYALDSIRNSHIEQLNQILEDMDEIYTYLFSIDYPSGLTQDLRHKTDQARNIIERTRGDVSISLQMSELKKCIESNIKSK